MYGGGGPPGATEQRRQTVAVPGAGSGASRGAELEPLCVRDFGGSGEEVGKI